MEETELICPECGKKVFKHFHRWDNHITHQYEYKWFWCENFCRLGCNNCLNVNSHGECNLDWCMNIKNWNPEPFKKNKKEKKSESIFKRKLERDGKIQFTIIRHNPIEKTTYNDYIDNFEISINGIIDNNRQNLRIYLKKLIESYLKNKN